MSWEEAPVQDQALTDQRVLVVGMARSGRAAAALAHSLGATVTTTDLRPELPAVDGCRAVHGRHDGADFDAADLVVVSPGVPARVPLLQRARAAGARVVGELGFACRFLADLPTLCVTGTNGKSSTTWFLGQLLQGAGRHPFVGGNFGVPVSELVQRRLAGRADDVDVLVLEISSYQLELPGDLRPLAAAVLNLTPDHLARHGDMVGYAAAKRVLVDRIPADGTAWLDADTPAVAAMARGLDAQVRWLGRHPGVVVEDDRLVFQGTGDDGTISLAPLQVLGAHNRDNVAAACGLALSLGLPRASLDLGRLTALAHRLQPVHDADGVTWVDDSKATNVEAALAGIRGVGPGQVLLLGGQGKSGADYGQLRPDLVANARAVIAFGASGREIADALGGLPLHRAAGLADAVALARTLARPGDTVLLSPACASFDEFRDFEHRGRVFADLARQQGPTRQQGEA